MLNIKNELLEDKEADNKDQEADDLIQLDWKQFDFCSTIGFDQQIYPEIDSNGDFEEPMVCMVCEDVQLLNKTDYLNHIHSREHRFRQETATNLDSRIVGV